MQPDNALIEGLTIGGGEVENPDNFKTDPQTIHSEQIQNHSAPPKKL